MCVCEGQTDMNDTHVMKKKEEKMRRILKEEINVGIHLRKY